MWRRRLEPVQRQQPCICILAAASRPVAFAWYELSCLFRSWNVLRFTVSHEWEDTMSFVGIQLFEMHLLYQTSKINILFLCFNKRVRTPRQWALDIEKCSIFYKFLVLGIRFSNWINYIRGILHQNFSTSTPHARFDLMMLLRCSSAFTHNPQDTSKNLKVGRILSRFLSSGLN